MTVEVATTVLEITALLLTILFIGMQFVSRQITSQSIPEEALRQVAKSIPLSTIGLFLSAMFAASHVTQNTESISIFIMMTFLTAALVFISVGLVRAAMAISDVLEEDLQSSAADNSTETVELTEFEE